MGSHGSATAEGQADVLAHFGITPELTGCPVISSLDVVELGETEEGIRTYADARAWTAGGVMFAARIKEHTDFTGTLESGLFKMMAIGLGKLAGAKYYHQHAYNLGMERVICSVGRRVLATGKILGGLAILEDAHHDTGKVAALRASEMEQREAELLALVKTWRPRLPVERVDLLVIDEMGKDISGTGMDTKIVNRNNKGAPNPWPGLPSVGRVYVRDLTEATAGNATGIGMADMVRSCAAAKMDRAASYVNALTASSCPVVRLPIHLPTDRECLDALWSTVGKFQPEDVGIVWIRNTLQLARLYATANLRPELLKNPLVEIVEGERELEFDADGNLPGWLAP
jgi:hypothetical protein